MRISDAQLDKRLKAIEAVTAGSKRRLDAIGRIDVTEHIADVYHGLHEDITTGQHEFYNLTGGRGSGKSSFCALEIVNGIMKDDTRRSNAIIVRKYAVTLRASVFSQIAWAIDELGVASHWKSTLQPMQFTYETGQVIKFTGLDDPQKLKSIKPRRGYFKYLWMEEFSEIGGEVEMRNLQQSILRGGSDFVVLRSFNPPINRTNWANTFVEIPDARSMTLLTDYTMIPSEWLGETFIAEAERLKSINPRAYEHEYLGHAIGSGGDVFPNVEVREITDEEIQGLDYIYEGLDFGFSVDPFCFIRVAYDRKKETIYILDEIYRRNCSNREIAEMIIAKGYDKAQASRSYFGETYRDSQRIVCDSAEPKSISDLRELGLKATKCTKFPGCVQYRVRWLQQRRIVVDPRRTPETHREITNYEYEVDRNGTFLSSLPDKDNHSIDALAYALDKPIYDRKYSA